MEKKKKKTQIKVKLLIIMNINNLIVDTTHIILY